jgi:hypothetical protein
MIRTIVPGDLWSLRGKPRNHIVLYNDALLVHPYRPFWFALRCILQGTGRDRALLVYRDRGVRATIHAEGRMGKPEQDITSLSIRGYNRNGVPSDHDIWYRLGERLCVHAGTYQIQRLYASVWSHQEDIREIFRQLAFQSFTRRLLLQLTGPDWDQGTTMAPMRQQSRRDSWAIHKLYGVLTPHLVQQAEVRIPHTWLLPLSPQWTLTTNRYRAWVLGDEDNIQAYLHVISGSLSHVMTLLIHPDIRDKATEVLRFGLSHLLDSRTVYLVLREYQQELLKPIQSLGFQIVDEQTLLVKNLIISARRSVFKPAFEPQPWDTKIPIPGISVSGEDAHFYGRTTRTNT